MELGPSEARRSCCSPTQPQRDTERADIDREQAELAATPKAERDEFAAIYPQRGLSLGRDACAPDLDWHRSSHRQRALTVAQTVIAGRDCPHLRDIRDLRWSYGC